MKHAFAAHPGKDPEHMVLGYTVALSSHEARTLKALEHKLPVDFHGIVLPLDLYDTRDVKYTQPNLNFTTFIAGDPKLNDSLQPMWELESVFPWTTFEVRDIRKAYVFLRLIAAQVENSMILSMPLAPYYGFTRTFDTRFDIPKEITNFEVFRRSIIARGE